jgi:hypothetical protein
MVGVEERPKWSRSVLDADWARAQFSKAQATREAVRFGFAGLLGRRCESLKNSVARWARLSADASRPVLGLKGRASASPIASSRRPVFGLLPQLRREFSKYPAVYRNQEGIKRVMPFGMAAMFVAMTWQLRTRNHSLTEG